MDTLILNSLRDLEHLASTLNARQHAGLKITPAMWSKLYQVCATARERIQIAHELMIATYQKEI